MKNLEKLLSLVLSNVDDLCIEYSNIDGQERLVVNGEELTKDCFDDSNIREKVTNFRQLIDKIETSDLVNIMIKLKEVLEVTTFNELLDQESYTEEEAVAIESMIHCANCVIYEYYTDKIENYQDIIDNIELD